MSTPSERRDEYLSQPRCRAHGVRECEDCEARYAAEPDGEGVEHVEQLTFDYCAYCDGPCELRGPLADAWLHLMHRVTERLARRR